MCSCCVRLIPQLHHCVGLDREKLESGETNNKDLCIFLQCSSIMDTWDTWYVVYQWSYTIFSTFKYLPCFDVYMYTYHIHLHHLHHLHPPAKSTPGLQLVWPDAFQVRWSSRETTMWGPAVITTKCNQPWLSFFDSALLIWVPSWIMWNTPRIINKFSCMLWDCTHFWFQFHINQPFSTSLRRLFFVFCL